MSDGIISKDILAGIADTELRAFVRHELRRNKHLAVRLSASFIDQIKLKPGVNKYSALLDEILLVDTHGKIRLTRRTLKLLDEVVQKYLVLARTFCQAAEYREAHELLQPLITKLHQFLDKQTEADPRLVERLCQTCDALHTLVQLPIAPELRSAIYSYGVGLLGMSYFKIYNVRRNLLSVLIQVMDELNQPVQLMILINEKINTAHDSAIWASWYYITRSRIHTERCSDHVLPLIAPKRIQAVASTLHGMHHDAALALCIDELYSSEDLSERLRIQWSGWRFDIACRNQDEQHAIHWGLELVRRSGDTNVFPRMLEIVHNAHNPADLAKRVLKTGDLILTGLLYASYQKWSDLIDLISRHGALEVLTLHLYELLAHDEARTEKLIHATLMHFVTHHAGVTCGDIVQTFFETLRKTRAGASAQPLQQELRRAFPGRFPIVTSGIEIS